MVLNSSGAWLVLKLMQWQAKETMMNIIRHNTSSYELNIFYIEDDKSIRWEDEDHEFSYQGHMYDVVASRLENGKRVLFCMNDSREERICAAIDRLAGGEWNEAASKQAGGWKLAIKLLQQVYDGPAEQMPWHCSQSSSQHLHNNSTLYPNYWPGIITPPPEMM